MQAYHHHHHQMANSNMAANGVPAANLLTTSLQMNSNNNSSSNMYQKPAMAAVNSYQDLVRNCLPQLSNYNENVTNNSSMVSFAVRLMSLNHHELRCLNGDPDLVRYINQVHMLIENKLQDLHANSASALHSQQQQHQHQQQQQQQHLISPLNYYTNYYNQQLRLNQLHDKQQQQHLNQQQQQQLLLMGHLNCLNTATNNSQDAHELTAIQHTLNNRVNPILAQQQQQQLNHHQHPQQRQPTIAPALDLRTTPRPMSAMSATPSPIGSRAGSTGSAVNSRQSASSLQHPKKVKLSEYRKMQQLAERGPVSSQPQNQQPKQNQQQIDDSTEENDAQDTSKLLNDETSTPGSSKRLQPDSGGDMTPAIATSTKGAHKKYKGEFDEPNAEEVIERQRRLNVPGHYHCKALDCGECACVIGSEFRDKTKREALEQLDRWRSLDVDERIKWKWDVNDLPKDIPLSDIKKFEDLRRDFSDGRADFGGASKRKPLGIRGTRQFLLMLYCLWGHPGREDAMQRKGYCPHCFAKIRTDNEQSTLVRVVNHFNMKHRKGANPRLSPHAESRQQSPQLVSSPQTAMQVRETLISMVESAVAAVSEEEATLDQDDDLSSTAESEKRPQPQRQQQPKVENNEDKVVEGVEEDKRESSSSCSKEGQNT